MKDRVVVRLSLQGWGQVNYHAELAIVTTVGGEEFLYVAYIDFRAVRGNIRIQSIFTPSSLKEEPGAIERLARTWLARSANDWCHDEQFMGAYEIYRDGQLYTSIKLEPHDSRWHLLMGVILSELYAWQLGLDRKRTVDVESMKIMIRRFSAFAAENITLWGDQNLSDH